MADWDLIKTILSIIGIFVSGAVWVIVLVSRVTTRVRDVERDIEDLEKSVEHLEEKTSFEHLEEVTKRVMLQIIHSKDFKDSIRDVLLHIEKNRVSSESAVFAEILDQLKIMKNEQR